jgi:hypothetical protein
MAWGNDFTSTDRAVLNGLANNMKTVLSQLGVIVSQDNTVSGEVAGLVTDFNSLVTSYNALVAALGTENGLSQTTLDALAAFKTTLDAQTATEATEVASLPVPPAPAALDGLHTDVRRGMSRGALSRVRNDAARQLERTARHVAMRALHGRQKRQRGLRRTAGQHEEDLAHREAVAMTPAKFAEYRKVLTAAVGLGLTYAAQFYGSNHWVVAAIAIASALGVYAVPNAAHKEPTDSVKVTTTATPGTYGGVSTIVPTDPPGPKAA